jgi:hypothetical protein
LWKGAHDFTPEKKTLRVDAIVTGYEQTMAKQMKETSRSAMRGTVQNLFRESSPKY